MPRLNISDFTGGLNNVQHKTRLAQNMAQSYSNVDTTKAALTPIKTNLGLSLIASAAFSYRWKTFL